MSPPVLQGQIPPPCRNSGLMGGRQAGSLLSGADVFKAPRLDCHWKPRSPVVQCPGVVAIPDNACEAFGWNSWLFPPPGTFCALDICLSQLQDVGTLNVHQTVMRMRTQRAFSIQTPEQYYFCYTSIIEHAQREGLLPSNHTRTGQEKS